MSGKSYVYALKSVINKIRDDRLSISVGSLIELLGGLAMIRMEIPEAFRFFKEFIQNADDKGSNSIVFKIFKDKIIVLNDGKPFDENDVESICRFRLSFKSPETSIGFLGLGFKTVFYISDKVRIITRKDKEYFSFSLDKEKAQKEFYKKVSTKIPQNLKEEFERVKHHIYKIYPIIEDEISEKDKNQLNEKFNVMFVIMLKNSDIAEKAWNWVKDKTNLNPRILLFLNHLKEIRIEYYEGNTEEKQKGERKLLKKKIGECNGFIIYEISDDSEKLEYLVFKKTYNIDGRRIAKEKDLLKDYKRDEVKQRNIYLVFRVNTKNNGKWLQPEEKATLHVLPYSLIPLRESPLSNLKFIPGGDFLANVSRDKIILMDCEWNKIILEELYKTIEHLIENVFKKYKKFKYNFLKILWHRTDYIPYGYEELRELLLNPIRKYIEKKEVFLTKDGKWVSMDKVVKVEPILRKILGNKIKDVIKDKEILHEDFEVPEEIEERIRLDFKDVAQYLREWFKDIVGKFDKLSLKEKRGVLCILSRLYKEYLQKYKSKRKEYEEKIEELLNILRRELKFNCKYVDPNSGSWRECIDSIGNLFLPSYELPGYLNLSGYPILEKIVNELVKELGRQFTLYAQQAGGQKVQYKFLNLNPLLQDLENKEEKDKFLNEVKELLRDISKEKDLKHKKEVQQFIKENLSYNIAMLYLKRRSSEYIQFIIPSPSLDIIMRLEHYIEVKSTSGNTITITSGEYSFLMRNKDKSIVLIVKYEYDDWGFKYDPSYIHIYEIKPTDSMIERITYGLPDKPRYTLKDLFES